MFGPYPPEGYFHVEQHSGRHPHKARQLHLCYLSRVFKLCPKMPIKTCHRGEVAGKTMR